MKIKTSENIDGNSRRNAATLLYVNFYFLRESSTCRIILFCTNMVSAAPVSYNVTCILKIDYKI